MATRDLRATLNSKYTGINACSFVYKNIPFVCSYCPVEKPLIGIKVPLIYKYGFTIIELLVTLAVVAVLLAIASPTMRTTIQNNRIVTLTNDLMSDVNYARTEAIKRAKDTQTTGICMSTSGTTCDGASWQGGRIVYTTDGGLFTVLRFRQAMTNNTLTTTTIPNPLTFSRRGQPLDSLGRPYAMTISFSLCDDRGPSLGKSVQININGQVSSTVPASC